MILWLASYPKSGNTWVRLIVSQLLYQSENKEENILKFVDKIPSYPKLKHYLNISIFHNKSEIKNKNDVVKNWIPTQEILNIDTSIKIFKTHNMLCKYQIENKEFSFTNLENTIGAIYIVRDPRSLISSLYHHFSLRDLSESVDMLTDQSCWGGMMSKPVPELLSSWENHYLSWKRLPKNLLLIKYEDLISCPEKVVLKISEFLKIFFEFEYDEKKIKNIIENTSFKNLKNCEKKFGFNESIVDKNTNKKKDFFYLGPKNDWKSLDKKLIERIEKNFEKSMSELSYI